jgi:hypothetical protein
MVLDNEFASLSFRAGTSGRNDASRPIRFGALSIANHEQPVVDRGLPPSEYQPVKP